MGNALEPESELGTRAIYRRLARNSAYLAGGTAASALFMMLAAVLNARALSAREFGVLVLFQSATMMVSTLMSFSTQQPVIKLGSIALAEGNLERLGKIVGLGLLFDIMAALAAAAIAFVLLFLGRDWFGLDRHVLGIGNLFAASLLFNGFLSANGVFRLFNRFGLLSMIQAGCSAGLLAVTAYLYISDAQFEAFCWAWAIYYALNAQIPLLVGLHLARRAGVPLGFASVKLGRADLRTFFAYCWTTWGMATVEALRSNGDSLLVGSAVSVEAAGIYNVAKQLAGVLRKLNTVYASAAFPEISTLSAQGKDASARRVRVKMLWVGAAVGAVAVSVAFFAGRPILGLLFGPGFTSAWIPLAILTGAAAAQLISHTLSMYIQVYVGPEKLFRLYLLAIIPFLLVVLPLTTAFSITGTALAQLLFSLTLIYLCHVTLRRADAA